MIDTMTIDMWMTIESDNQPVLSPLGEMTTRPRVDGVLRLRL